MDFYQGLVVFGPMVSGPAMMFFLARFIIGNTSTTRCLWVSLGAGVATHALFLGITYLLVKNAGTEFNLFTSLSPGLLVVLLTTWWVFHKGFAGNGADTISVYKAFLLASTYCLVQSVALCLFVMIWMAEDPKFLFGR